MIARSRPWLPPRSDQDIAVAMMEYGRSSRLTSPGLFVWNVGSGCGGRWFDGADDDEVEGEALCCQALRVPGTGRSSLVSGGLPYVPDMERIR